MLFSFNIIMNQDVIDLIKSLGVGCRHPNDEFFRQGNELNKIHKIFGVHEVDDEDLYHESYSLFSCQVPGCSVTCKTVSEYDQHYNSCHRFSCSQCKKYLPSNHLLDLHLMETHDAYFLALADKKPMFQCYLQECKNVFQTSQERRDHCITEHKFPSNFRFDVAKRNNIKKSKTKNKTKPKDVEMAENDCEEVKMEISTDKNLSSEKSMKNKVKHAPKIPKSLCGNRKPILDMKCFVKDMKESLPSQ